MDSSQFDELVARISNALSRREAVKGLTAGALTSAGIGAVAAGSADAAKNKGRGDGKKGRGNGDKGRDNDANGEQHKNGDNNAKGHGRRKKKKCKLQPGQTRCGRRVCVNLQNNSAHCGNCGTSCATGQFCSNGTCQNAT